jgi:hypothetical protein
LSDNLSVEEASEVDGVLAIEDTASQSQQKRKTVRLSGFIGNVEVL